MAGNATTKNTLRDGQGAGGRGPRTEAGSEGSDLFHPHPFNINIRLLPRYEAFTGHLDVNIFCGRASWLSFSLAQLWKLETPIWAPEKRAMLAHGTPTTAPSSLVN